MTDQVIIDAAARFAKKPMPPSTDPDDSRWTTDELRAMFAPSVKTLPFVSAEWHNEYWPESMWIDVPTDNYPADHKRGKHFAGLTIGALMADQCKSGRALELIFEAIVNDAIRRRARGGKGARSLPGAVQGYLDGLASFITGQCRRSGPPAA
jgi:hypothetical protein